MAFFREPTALPTFTPPLRRPFAVALPLRISLTTCWGGVLYNHNSKEGKVNYYQHRISYCSYYSYKLLEEGYLTIGFSDLAKDENFLRSFYDVNPDDTIREVINRDGWGVNIWSLWYFLGMKKGDYVVVPEYDGMFSIYEIVDERGSSVYLASQKEGNATLDSVKADDIDLGFIRHVKPVVTNLSRSDYADAKLQQRMKARQTTLWIDDLEKSIEEAIKQGKENKPIDVYDAVVKELKQPLYDNLMKFVQPEKLEKLVKSYCEKVLKADSVFIPSKNEQGKEGDADVVATFEGLKLILYIQVKKHEGYTDDWAIEQISAYSSYKKQNFLTGDDYSVLSWVISTGKFSEDTILKARDKNVRLIDGFSFMKMLLDGGLSCLDTY